MPRGYDPNYHRRRSIRLPRFDYSSSGAYFVNIVTLQRTSLFGAVVDGEMQLNPIGQMVDDTWRWLEEQYPYLILDEYIVMPDHLHGIIVIDDSRRGVSRNAPTTPGANPPRIQKKPLGQMVGAFKTVSTKRFNLASGSNGRSLWQRNYWERVIRDDHELNWIRKYIRNNPLQYKPDQQP